jgi:DNA primase
VAAIKGSALTTDHVQLLARSVDQIILALDADAAGLAATEKAIGVVAQAQVSREQPLSLLVIRVPSGKDPDEMSQTEPKLWRETAKHPITPYEFLLAVACEKFDPTTLMGKQQIMQQVTPIFAQIQHAVQFEYFTKVLAERLDVSISSVQKDIKAFARRAEQKAPEKMLSKKPAEQKKLSKRVRLENYLLFLVFHSLPADQKKRLNELASLPLQNEGLSAALTALLRYDTELTAAIKKIDIDQQELLFELSTHPEMEEAIGKLNIAQEWNTRMTELQKEVRSSRAKEIGKRLEELDALTARTAEEDAEYTHLLQELTVVRVSSPSS